MVVMKKLILILSLFNVYLNSSENSVEKKLSSEQIEQANEDLSKTLLSFGYKKTINPDSNYKTFCKDVTIAIQKGANVNTTNVLGETALHVICENCLYKGYDCKPLIRFLLEKGIDVNIKNNYGRTALMHVIPYCYKEDIIQLIIKNNAELDTTDKSGITALTKAAMYGNEQAVDILFRAGADITIQNKENTLNLFDFVASTKIYENGIKIMDTYIKYKQEYNDDCKNNFKQLKAKLKSKNISLQDLTGMYEDLNNIIVSYISLADWYNWVYPQKKHIESSCCIIL